MSKRQDRGARTGTPWFLYLVPLIAFLAAWFVFTYESQDRQFIFSSPEKVAVAFMKLTASGELIRHTGVTLFEALAGFASGTTIGAAIGLILWYSKTVANVARPYIAALGSVPIFALAPIIIVWFGIGIFSKVILAFLSTVVLAIVQAYQGAMSVEQRYLQLMNVVGASKTQVFKFVVVPSSLIWVVNAMKLNIGLALLGAFIGEFISAEQGLGYMIVKASGLYNMAKVFVGIGALMATALILTFLVNLLEKRLLQWQAAKQAG